MLRRAAGGDAPDALLAIGRDDLVKSLLTRMTIDSFPLLLAPTDPRRMMSSISLFRHPLQAQRQTAVQSDASLARIFFEDDPGIGRRGQVYTSLGRGGGVQDVMFGEMMIASAWDVATVAGNNPRLDQLVEQLHRNVDTLRASINGEHVTVPALVVFTGFRTFDSRSIPTPWGLLRPLHEWERELAPTALEGSLTTILEDDREVTVSYAGEMVIETEVPYVVSLDPIPDVIDGSWKWPTVQGSIP